MAIKRSRRDLNWRVLNCLCLALLVFAMNSSPVLSKLLDVDIQLIVAADASDSMDAGIGDLQRRGYANALRSGSFHQILRNGPSGRIGFSYVEWGDVGQLKVIVPWTLIDAPETAIEIADRLERAPISNFGKTSISHILEFSRDYFGSNEFRGLRVIDVSGNGPNNQGRAVTAIRDRLVSEGITINGLPIILPTQSPKGLFGRGFDRRKLGLYYRDCVIGGARSFMLPVTSENDIAEAIKLKLLVEVAGRAGAVPIKFAPASRERPASLESVEC